MSENPQTTEDQRSSGSSDIMVEKKKKWRDFWLGIIGSLIVNAILVVVVFLLGVGIATGKFNSVQAAGSPLITILISMIEALIWGLPLAVNMGLIILALVKKRPWIVLGILASYVLALAIGLVAGILFTAACFLAGNQL